MRCGYACFLYFWIYLFLYFDENLPKAECINLCFLQLNLRTYRFRVGWRLLHAAVTSSFRGVPFRVLDTGLLALLLLTPHHSLFFLCWLVFLFSGLTGFCHPFVLPAWSSVFSWTLFLYMPYSLSASSFHMVNLLNAALGVQAFVLQYMKHLRATL